MVQDQSAGLSGDAAMLRAAMLRAASLRPCVPAMLRAVSLRCCVLCAAIKIK